MTDPRTPLTQGEILRLDGSKYIINSVIGYGGSCIAYSSEREPNEYERGIGMLTIHAVIKEFYPLPLSESIERNGLTLEIGNSKEFDKLKRRFENGASRQVAFYAEDCNHSLPPARLDAANGTVYSVVDLAQGTVLADNTADLRMRDIAEILGSLCNALKKLHNAGKLYLDLKPSNIFLFDKDPGEQYRAALFDFDALIPISELGAAAIPFSDDWSPPEQVNEIRDKISFATDIYAIGAVFWWLISGGKVTDTLLNAIIRRRFSLLDDCAALRDMKNARRNAEQILDATLKREPNDRVQTVEELLG
jgi:serine/threonine protein kinase